MLSVGNVVKKISWIRSIGRLGRRLPYRGMELSEIDRNALIRASFEK
jgi:hypothetical protein